MEHTQKKGEKNNVDCLLFRRYLQYDRPSTESFFFPQFPCTYVECISRVVRPFLRLKNAAHIGRQQALFVAKNSKLLLNPRRRPYVLYLPHLALFL